MGHYTFRLPDIGEGIAEAEIVAWHVSIGDRIEEDGPLADMMTDKATVEMESPVSGIVRELAGAAGDVVAIGSPLVVIETDEPEADVPAAPATDPAPSSAQPDGDASAVEQENEQKKVPDQVPAAPRGQSRGMSSPAVRARAKALAIDLADVPPEDDGVITHAALDAWLVSRLAVSAPTKPAPNASAAAPAVLTGVGETVKVIGLRRRIAENMAASKRHIPHFSYVQECDVTALEAFRAEINAERSTGASSRPKLTVLPFLITAICRSLPDFPMINARYDDEANVVTRYDSVHLGVATQTDSGLMVPVIRDAHTMTLSHLASEISRLSSAARDGSARSEELSGSTLTITSLGTLGGIATTPVINRPEVAIIGPNRIVERAVFVSDGDEGDRLEKRKLMNISISCDHRVVDGWDAASFVQAVKRLLENPRLLVAI